MELKILDFSDVEDLLAAETSDFEQEMQRRKEFDRRGFHRLREMALRGMDEFEAEFGKEAADLARLNLENQVFDER